MVTLTMSQWVSLSHDRRRVGGRPPARSRQSMHVEVVIVGRREIASRRSANGSMPPPSQRTTMEEMTAERWPNAGYPMRRPVLLAEPRGPESPFGLVVIDRDKQVGLAGHQNFPSNREGTPANISGRETNDAAPATTNMPFGHRARSSASPSPRTEPRPRSADRNRCGRRGPPARGEDAASGSGRSPRPRRHWRGPG